MRLLKLEIFDIGGRLSFAWISINTVVRNRAIPE